jgi:hypothetical protein
MAVGGVETVGSGTRSMVLGIPLGWPIIAAAVLATWLFCVVLATALQALGSREP